MKCIGGHRSATARQPMDRKVRRNGRCTAWRMCPHVRHVDFVDPKKPRAHVHRAWRAAATAKVGRTRPQPSCAPSSAAWHRIPASASASKRRKRMVTSSGTPSARARTPARSLRRLRVRARRRCVRSNVMCRRGLCRRYCLIDAAADVRLRCRQRLPPKVELSDRYFSVHRIARHGSRVFLRGTGLLTGRC